jgi:hypothetical protein
MSTIFEVINVGATANDGAGDPLRTAFQKINYNFELVNQTGVFTADGYSDGMTQGQVIFETPVTLFTQATIQINSQNVDTTDSQNVTLTASISNDGTSVSWTGHSTLFRGDPLLTYDMDVTDGNVRVLVNPLVDATVYNFISGSIAVTVNPPGTPLAIEGSSDTVLSTESNLVISTQ